MLNDLLVERYPQLLFLLSTQKPQRSAQYIEDASVDIGNFVQKIQEHRPELILLVGLSHPDYFLLLEEWLILHPDVDFLVFEESLEVIDAFLTTPHAERILSHPQIHLRYILEHAHLMQGLKEAVKEYPAERVWIEVVARYQTRYSAEELSLMVLRRATISAALFNEDVYYHLLFRNLLDNFKRLPQCFYADALQGKFFKNMPAVICGAGPSLKDHIPFLKTMGHQALIIAGGSTLAALSSQGVHPHIGLALDPNPEEYDRLKANGDFEIPLLFGSRVASSIFRTCNGPLGYMRTFSGGLAEQALEKQLSLDQESLFHGVSQEGLSVTVMCVAVAIRLGCNPIMFSGIDLAYTEGRRYAEGVVQDASINLHTLEKESKNCERLICRENRHGQKVYTTVKWIMEAQAIEDFIRLHPEIKAYDCIDQGLGFKSCEYVPLPVAIEKYCQHEYDLKGYVHQCIQNLPHLNQYKEQVTLFIQRLNTSIERCHSIVKEFLKYLAQHNHHQNPEESSRLTLCRMDLEEESAYEYLLEPMEELMMKRLQKEHRLLQEEIIGEYTMQIILLEKQWKHFERLLKHYLKLFSKH